MSQRSARESNSEKFRSRKQESVARKTEYRDDEEERARACEINQVTKKGSGRSVSQVAGT